MSKTPNYTVVVGKIPTTLTMVQPPPSNATPGTNYYVIAQLKDYAGNPLSGKYVVFYTDSSAAGTTTGDDGKAVAGVTFAVPGTFTMYAQFAGDTTYEGC